MTATGVFVRRVVAVVAVVLGLIAVGSGVASAASRQPIDWTVRTTFVGPKGEDVPMRIGQHDDVLGDGFGVRHILDGHQELPDDRDIETVLASKAACGYVQGEDKWECQGDAGDRGTLLVVFTEREDDRADGRPVGIITAFYAPKGCPC